MLAIEAGDEQQLAADIAAELRGLLCAGDEIGMTDEGVDVRACVEDDELHVLFGDVQYDTRHYPTCAASTLFVDSDVDELAADLASDLIDQLAELAAYEAEEG